VGDIELVSKTGTLTLKGYGGTAGNGSEQVVKLDTANGGINLEGAKVDIQGSQLTAQKDIKIVSSKDDVLVDGIKNNFSSIPKLNLAQDYSLELDRINKERVKLQSQEYLNDYSNLLKSYQYYNEMLFKYWDHTNLNQTNNKNAIIWVNAYKEYEKDYDLFKNKYAIRVKNSMLGDPPFLVSIFDGNPYSVGDVFSFKYDDDYIDDIKRNEIFYKSNLNGSEHAEAKLTSKSGNINITSAKGLSISGGNISAQSGQVNLEASGVLAEQYKSTINSGANQPPKSLNASIIIDGHTDFYEKGTESEGNYSFKTLVSPTIINGDKGVNIRTVGKTKDDNLVLQATGITSKNGDVKIESNKSILFDAAIEQSYDLTTTTEKKKSWGGLKKKYITTVSESNDTNAASVDISAKNISIETKKLDPSVDAKIPDNNIDIYSGRFTAEGGTISIKSGGNLNFYTVEESSSSTVDVTKKTSYSKLISLLGSSKTTTNTTRTQISELPANLKADYINTQAVDKTKLEGTEFEYLKGATIETGGTLELIAAKTSITELFKKEKSSLAWQAMQDKGSITETAQLPSFNGPVLPTFKAAGGLSVQVPISEKDVNKVELRDAILDLSKKPGNEYLKELVNRKDVDWQTVLLTQKDWDYKQQGLTAAGAAIIVIIITIVTMGTGTAAAAGAAGGTAASGTTVGLGASMIGSAGITTTAAGAIVPSTLGAMANAAITSLATQAGVSLINNGGDIGKTLKDLGSKDSIKNLATSVVTAGLMSQVGSALNLKPDSTMLPDRLLNNITSSVGSTLVQTAIKGGDLEENLKVALLSGLAGALQGELASQIGDSLYKADPTILQYTIHKIAHAAAGCAAAAATKASCEAGAIGAGVGEIVASLMPKPVNGIEYNDEEKVKIKNMGKVVAGVVSAYAGYDVNTAANSADIAIQNNYLTHYSKAKFVADLTKCKVSSSNCDNIVQNYQNLSKTNDIELATVCNNAARSQDCNNMLQAALDYAGSDFNQIYGINSPAMANLKADQIRSRELVLKNIFKDTNNWYSMIDDIDLRADFFSAMYAKTGAEWFRVANETSRAAFVGLGAEGAYSGVTFALGGVFGTITSGGSVNLSDVYNWRSEAGYSLMKAGYNNFKQLYDGKVTDIVAWNIGQMQQEQKLLQPIHEKYFKNSKLWVLQTWVPTKFRNNPVNLLDYNSRVKYGCIEMGYTIAQGCKP
jgi:filamentous hemagglutinin